MINNSLTPSPFAFAKLKALQAAVKQLESLPTACKAFSLANAKGKGVDELVIRSSDD
jgi:hypothetical protein